MWLDKIGHVDRVQHRLITGSKLDPSFSFDVTCVTSVIRFLHPLDDLN